MTEPLTTFRRLLNPVNPLAFVKQDFGVNPIHVPGKASKVRSICSWTDFADLMNMTGLWSGETLKLVLDGRTLAVGEYCVSTMGRDAAAVQRPDYAKVQSYLEQGATIVADLIETLSPGIRAASTALEMGVGAHVTCNAYMSQNARRAFPSHFDTMDVFALQIEGSKVWRIYEGRFEHPMERPGYSYPYFDQKYHETAKGKLAFEVEMQPGDLLYIPAGVYHDALASSEACLHLSFGATRPTVLDYFSWLTRSLDDLAEFRTALPDYKNADERTAVLAEAETRLAGLLSSGGPRNQFGEEMQRQAHRLISPVSIPPSVNGHQYRVAPAEIVKQGDAIILSTSQGDTNLDTGLAQMARWLLERDLVTESEITQRFRKLEPAALDDAISSVIEAGLVVQLTR